MDWVRRSIALDFMFAINASTRWGLFLTSRFVRLSVLYCETQPSWAGKTTLRPAGMTQSGVGD